MKPLRKTDLSYLITGFIVALFLVLGTGNAIAVTEKCGSTTWELRAGKHIDVGSVTVSNDKDNLYINYHLDDPKASFGTLHVWVGSSEKDEEGRPEGLPLNKKGTPVIGQFPFHSGTEMFPSAEGLKDYTFTIPFSEIMVSGLPDGTNCDALTLAVVTHAEVNIRNADGTVDEETAFGGDLDGPGVRWWFYGEYTICCDSGEVKVCHTETAFAKGTHIFATSADFNPDNLPSLELVKSRWGWAINLTATGEYTFNIWAGAGKNDTTKGEQVGTLTVNWDGTKATVTYSMNPGNILEEVHIFAGDEEPKTTAPGQYGYPTGGYDMGGITEFVYTVPLADKKGGDGVWLIAHAVVSKGGCE